MSINTPAVEMPGINTGKPYSVNQINHIDVSLRVDDSHLTGTFTSVYAAEQTMRVWLKRQTSQKKPVVLKYVVTFGIRSSDPIPDDKTAASSEAALSVSPKIDFLGAGIFTVESVDFPFAGFIEWLANTMEHNGRLKTVDYATDELIEVHVSWDIFYPYLQIIRRKPGSITNHHYNIAALSWSTRQTLISWLEGHQWPFHFSDREANEHFYAGDVNRIHQELSRIARNAYNLSGVNNIISQASALDALLLFYTKFAVARAELNEQYMLTAIAHAAAPGTNPDIRESALNLLPCIKPELLSPVLDEITATIAAQLNDWKAMVKTITDAIVEKPVVPHPEVEIKSETPSIKNMQVVKVVPIDLPKPSDTSDTPDPISK